jgi:hypothetical protein
MKFPIGAILNYATRATMAIATGVPAVQAFATSLQAGSGADKKQSVLLLVQAELAAAELGSGRDLANDADVMDAAGKVIDAVAAFHKVIARKAIGPAPSA